MKKLLALLLAVTMLLVMGATFTACDLLNGGADTTTTAGNEGEKPDEKPAEKQVLKMGTNAYFQPYEYYENGKIIGIDAEIAAAIADKLGMELEIVDMEFDSIITAVNADSVDFGMAGMTVTEDRLLEVDFSISYAIGVQAFIV